MMNMPGAGRKDDAVLGACNGSRPCKAILKCSYGLVNRCLVSVISSPRRLHKSILTFLFKRFPNEKGRHTFIADRVRSNKIGE